VIRDVAKQTDVILIEDEFLIPGDDVHFRDTYHFADAGNQVMAERVVKSLIRSKRFEQLTTAHKSAPSIGSTAPQHR